MSPKPPTKSDNGTEPEEEAAEPALSDDADEIELDSEEQDDDEDLLEEDDDEEEVAEEKVAVRAAPRPAPPRPWGGNRGAVSPEDLSPEELTPEMRWPPGSWVKVNSNVRHSTGEPIEGIQPGDVGQVIAALSQTLVVLFPTRDNRREVVHIESIEAVEH